MLIRGFFSPISFVLLSKVLILQILNFENATAQNKMQVIISNSPQFYYSHRCQLILSVISTSFTNYNPQGSQIFIITLLEANSGVRFLQNYSNLLIFASDSTVSKQANINNCGRGPTNTSLYIGCIMSNRFMGADLKFAYNSTHQMYKFTLNNIICPNKSIGQGQNGYHIKLKLQIPEKQSTSAIKLQETYTYRFVNLKYRIIERVLANPVVDSNQAYIIKDNKNIQARNYKVGSSSLFSILIDIQNQTQINTWQQFQLIFTQKVQSIKLSQSLPCTLSSYSQIMNSNAFVPQSTNNLTCSYQRSSNMITLKNPYYNISNFVENPFFNIYQVYQKPSIRLNISIIINFIRVGSLKFHYRLTTKSRSYINDSLKQTQIDQRQVILFENENNPQTIYGLAQAQYLKIQPIYRAYVLKNINNNQSNSSTFNFQDFVSEYILSSKSVLSIFAILLTVLLTIFIRKQIFLWQKWVFFGFILTQLWFKLFFTLYVKDQGGSQTNSDKNNELSFILSAFMCIQYGGLNIALFLTYFAFIFSNKQYFDHKNLKKSFIISLVLLFYNYKLYCLCLFNLSGIGVQKLKAKRFRNDQLYVKYCWHLSLQILILIVQIYYVIESNPNLVLTIIFCLYEGLYIVIMSLVGKVTYNMLKHKKIKNKLRSICRQSKKSYIKSGMQINQNNNYINSKGHSNTEKQQVQIQNENIDKNENVNNFILSSQRTFKNNSKFS